LPRTSVVLALVVFTAAIAFSPKSTPADDFTPFGSVQIVTDSNGNAAWQITSDPSVAPGYGGIVLNLPAGFTLGGFTSLSVVLGGGPDQAGSIRFALTNEINVNQAAFIYPGGETNTDPNGGAIASTVNFVTSSGLYVNTNGFGFGSANIDVPFDSFGDFVTAAGASTPVDQLTLVADGGTSDSPEVFDVESVDINGTMDKPAAATPEPGSLVLFGSGVLGLAGLLRQKLKIPARRCDV
jgi:PEP-CTERM motif